MKIETKQKSFTHKKAYFDYQTFENYEAGVVLTGLEIKAIRMGKIDLSTSYAKIIKNEAFWLGGNIGVEADNRQRTRKLLLKKEQIEKINGKLTQDRMTLVPLKLYFKKGRAKMLLGLCKSKKKYDKRELIKKRDQDRENQRNLKLK